MQSPKSKDQSPKSIFPQLTIHRCGRLCGGLLLFFLLFFFPQWGHAQFNVDRLVMTGRSALYYEDYVLSIQYFNQAINSKPYLYEPWFFRGVAKYYLDDYVGAENDVSEAIKLNPYISSMYELRGICRIRQKKFDKAIADYDKAIKYEPQMQGYWYNRALCRMEKKDYSQAQLDLDTIITRWKKFASAYTLKAEVFLQQKDTLKADVWLGKSLALDPYDADAWTSRGLIGLSRRDWRQADTCLSRAIHLKPKTVANYVNRAVARINLNNLRGAMADYDTALDLDPNNFLAHYNRGLMRMQLGDDNRAILDFDYVIKMEPDNLLAIFNRGVLHEKTGNPRAAIRDYTTVIDEFPNFWTGLAYRARCYRALGMTAKAELDEFRIFKAQMDKHIGRQQRWSSQKVKQMRKRSEIDPNKYDQLVVADEQEVPHEYKSEYRGRVQNRSVSVTLMPMYQLSYFKYQNGVDSYMAFSADVEQFNATRQPSRPIYVTCRPEQLSEDASRAILAHIDTLSMRIDAAQNSKFNLLMERAVAYAVVQDFDAAITDLSACLQADSTSSMAWWQRAVCSAMSEEFARAQGIAAQVRSARIIDDFNEAIRLTPQNAYLYYDRANYYAQHKDYTRAIDDYTRALELDQRLAEAWYNRGIVRLESGNRAEATADMSKAGELGIYDAYSVIKRNSKEQ